MCDAIDHDILKRVLVQTLDEYSHRFSDSGTDVSVTQEQPVTVDGRQRNVDVMLTKHNEHSVEVTAKYAFEVKTSLTDSVGVSSQLKDYAAADCQPILVAADYVFDEHESLKETASLYGPVVGAVALESGQFDLEVISGDLERVGLYDLSNHWSAPIDYARGQSQGETNPDTEPVSLPWIYRRDSPVDDRDVTKQLHLQKETARKFVEYQNDIEDRLQEDVYRADLREATMLAGLQSPDFVVAQLREWGYNSK